MPWEKITTHGGYTYTDWRDPLPRIPDVILNSIIYLYPDRVLADTGGDAGGSGQTHNPLPMKALVHAGMMGVVPAWFLDDFRRTSPRLIEQRRRDDEVYSKWKPTGETDAPKQG